VLFGVVARHNPDFAAFQERLSAAGKTKEGDPSGASAQTPGQAQCQSARSAHAIRDYEHRSNCLTKQTVARFARDDRKRKTDGESKSGQQIDNGV
jgi:hypothetical protein